MMAAVVGTLACVLAGCGSGKPSIEADPLTAARDAKFATSQRVEAVQRAWSEAKAGKTNASAVRSDLKDLAWGVDLPVEVRLAALNAVFEDEAPATLDDSRSMTRLMLPREASPAITSRLCEEAVKRSWKDCTPSLVRSLSRWHEGIPDARRDEYQAIAALNPGEKPEAVVYGVFLNPPDKSVLGFVPPERAQADAWDLLRRLDTDGSVRGSLVFDLEKEQGPGVALMRRAFHELHVVPLTGDEYLWLVSLGNERDKAKAEWWNATTRLVASLDEPRRAHLQVRHLEAIRATNVLHPERLSMDRAALLEEARSRLSGRSIHTRTPREREIHRPPPETLAAWEEKLSWGDLVALLLVDDALRDPALVASLFAQRDLDREDEKAEYGGLLRADGPAGAPCSAVLYPPRQGERRSDKEFVASTDMMQQGDLALAHYHFHAQVVRNADFAGPSAKDLTYAARFGRTCIVFTSMALDRMDADYYQPDGVVIDLGDIRQGSK